MWNRLNRDERFGLAVTTGAHAVLLALLLFMRMSQNDEQRTAFIEVTLGEFRFGAASEFSNQPNADLATTTNPENAVVDPANPTEAVELPTTERVVIDPARVNTPEQGKANPDAADERVRVATTPDDRRRDLQDREGAETAGNVRGTTGSATAQEGTTNDPVRSSPFSLVWEGDIQRAPLRQPLPNYVYEVDAIIIMRFEVRPDGTVGGVVPIRRANPELEREVTNTLRNWRFSPLPSNVPQTSQWGRITFRFVMN